MIDRDDVGKRSRNHPSRLFTLSRMYLKCASAIGSFILPRLTRDSLGSYCGYTVQYHGVQYSKTRPVDSSWKPSNLPLGMCLLDLTNRRLMTIAFNAQQRQGRRMKPTICPCYAPNSPSIPKAVPQCPAPWPSPRLPDAPCPNPAPVRSC